MTSFQLKCLAAVLMLLDHIGALFFPEQLWLRGVGRLSFPLFAFLAAEGCRYTRNLYRYLCRIAVFATLSEVPFDLAFHNTLLFWGAQNVLWTLLLGAMASGFWLRLGNEKPGVCLCFAALLSVFASFFKTDYGWYGVLLVFWFCYCGQRFGQNLRERLFLSFTGMIALTVLFVLENGVLLQLLAVLALLPIAFYNGKKGRKDFRLFYGFYPGHLLILWGISHFFC